MFEIFININGLLVKRYNFLGNHHPNSILVILSPVTSIKIAFWQYIYSSDLENKLKKQMFILIQYIQYTALWFLFTQQNRKKQRFCFILVFQEVE